MSVRIWYREFSPRASPIAIPATGAFSGTPPSMRASEPAQTDAIDVEPFDAIDSDTTLIVYGKAIRSGSTVLSAFSTRAPWPTLRRFVPPRRPVSPDENGG